jgi:hypothetical protein
VDAVTNGLRLLLPFALLAVESVTGTPGAGALPPIVFVSRAHPETLNGKDFGPPIEIAGRETTVGGSLLLLRRDRSVLTLAGPENGIFDVQRPMVSFDGTRVMFSGVRERGGMWRIFEVRMDGSGLRQLTADVRGATIPDDPRRPGENERIFERFGDFSPAYLPDGRIVFSSSRYPSLSPSTGERALNLYVMDADGGNLHRITNCRSGAIDPYVMADGRIVFGLWKDNINLPSLYTRGLQPVDPTGNSHGGAFRPWAVNPDGSSADRLGYMGGLLAHGRGGGLHFREMPNGEIVYTRRAKQDLTGPTLATAIAKFHPGDGRGNMTAGLGDPVNLEAPHALCPTPLPDGRILFSYTAGARLRTATGGRTTADFDYGLYLCDGDFRNVRLVYNNPDTEELDAVAVYSRPARALPDKFKLFPSEDPGAPAAGTAELGSLNVYADVDRRFTSQLSPLPGSVAAIDVYDDSQTFFTTPEYPLIHRQMPRLWGSFPVEDDGSYTVHVPADRRVLVVLRSPTGVAVRYPLAPTTPGQEGETVTAFFSHELGRPGEAVQCTGCHLGHRIHPDLNHYARANIARLATATASSSRSAFFNGAHRLTDGAIGRQNGNFQWIPAAFDANPWVKLEWEQPVKIERIVIYPRPGFQLPLGEFTVSLGERAKITASPDAVRPDEPIAVAASDTHPVSSVLIRMISGAAQRAPGIAEISVNGTPMRIVGVPPEPPPRLTVAPGSLALSWPRSPAPTAIGYKIIAGGCLGGLPVEWDVGNVTNYQPHGLTRSGRHWFEIRAYDAGGRLGPPRMATAWSRSNCRPR